MASPASAAPPPTSAATKFPRASLALRLTCPLAPPIVGVTDETLLTLEVTALGIMKRFAKTIEIDVAPDRFVFRCGTKERAVPTQGYIRKIRNDPLEYCFDEERHKDADTPISLFAPLPADLQEDFVHVLDAFLLYGVRHAIGPRPNPIRPIVVFTGIERFETKWGFEYAVFNEAAKLFALQEKEVYIRRGG